MDSANRVLGLGLPRKMTSESRKFRKYHIRNLENPTKFNLLIRLEIFAGLKRKI